MIIGVSGAGKTTVGGLLAQQLGWKFYDADDFHPQANIDKMRNGQPLTDEDRQPWLERVRELIERANEDAVIACSALKKRYRDSLRIGDKVKFVFLCGSRTRTAEQLKSRRGHYFDPKLLDSQFADLEEPVPAENVLTVNLRGNPNELVAEIVEKLQLGK